MADQPKTASAYVAVLPDDRRKALNAVRKVIKANLDTSVREGVQYGMVGYFIPHSTYPAGYHCDPKEPLPFLSLASQKNHMALYLFCLYCDTETLTWFQSEWAKTGKKLDMGKACLRFKKIEDLPLPLIGKLVKRMTAKRFIDSYESSLSSSATSRKAPRRKKA